MLFRIKPNPTLPEHCQRVTVADGVDKLECGLHHAIVISNKGILYGMKLSTEANRYGQQGQGTSDGGQVAQIKAAHTEEELIRNATVAWLGKGFVPERKVIEVPESKPLDRVDFSLINNGDHVGRALPVDIACGYNHSLLLLKDGSVCIWGNNTSLQLGLGPYESTRAVTTKPTLVSGLRNVVKIACTSETSFFVTKPDDGSTITLAAGHGLFGTLGSGSASQHLCGNPTPVMTISRAQYYNESKKSLLPRTPQIIACGEKHVICTLDTHDRYGIGDDLFVWGSNRAYQLGTGKHANCFEPVSPSPDVLMRALGINGYAIEQGGRLQAKVGTRIACGGDTSAFY